MSKHCGSWTGTDLTSKSHASSDDCLTLQPPYLKLVSLDCKTMTHSALNSGKLDNDAAHLILGVERTSIKFTMETRNCKLASKLQAIPQSFNNVDEEPQQRPKPVMLATSAPKKAGDGCLGETRTHNVASPACKGNAGSSNASLLPRPVSKLRLEAAGELGEMEAPGKSENNCTNCVTMITRRVVMIHDVLLPRTLFQNPSRAASASGGWRHWRKKNWRRWSMGPVRCR